MSVERYSDTDRREAREAALAMVVGGALGALLYVIFALTQPDALPSATAAGPVCHGNTHYSCE